MKKPGALGEGTGSAIRAIRLFLASVSAELYTLKIHVTLLFGNDFQTLLNKDSEIDDDLVSGTPHFVVLEEYIGSKLLNGFVNHIFAIVLGFRGGTLICV